MNAEALSFVANVGRQIRTRKDDHRQRHTVPRRRLGKLQQLFNGRGLPVNRPAMGINDQGVHSQARVERVKCLLGRRKLNDHQTTAFEKATPARRKREGESNQRDDTRQRIYREKVVIGTCCHK